MRSNDPDDNRSTGGIWPPPPTVAPPQRQSYDDLADTYVKKATTYCILGWIVCVLFQIMTIYCAVQANRAAGKGVATLQIAFASVQIAGGVMLVVYLIIARLASP